MCRSAELQAHYQISGNEIIVEIHLIVIMRIHQSELSLRNANQKSMNRMMITGGTQTQAKTAALSPF